jgi:hypothetical protein
MNSGHSVPRCRASATNSWIRWTPEDLVPDPFVGGAQGKLQCSRLRGDAGTETEGGGL